ncbi:MAG: response regulator [Candidatus Paceibacterota bacterium]|jgi:DNA-binding NtrC family response regulator
MENTPKQILVIEDDKNIILGYQGLLKKFPFEFIVATTLEEAERLYPIREWDVIVVDGCLGGDDFNTGPLVKEIRASGYTGHMIAASGNPDLRRFLVEAGCSMDVEKRFVPANILNLLQK